MSDVEPQLPGMLPYMELDQLGVHITGTTDNVYITSGEVRIELDKVIEAQLRPGDPVAQNGTRHAWSNKGSESCHMALRRIGAGGT